MNMLTVWTATSVQRQLAIVVAVSSMLFLATARVVRRYLTSSDADGRIVNIAGRQRMLSQRIAREALAVAAGIPEAPRRLGEAADEFQGSLVDLVHGAPARGLPSAPDGARERLLAVEVRWRAVVEAIEMLRADPSRHDRDRAVARIQLEADWLLRDTDHVVAYFDDEFSRKVRELRTRMTLLGAGGAIILAATYVLLLQGARQRAQRAESAVRLKEHQLADLAEERRDLIRRLLSASEDERRRVASDIHDGPTQQLTGAAMLLEAALQDERTSEEALERVEVARQYLESALDETRRIISDLRPPLLEDLGVAEALRRSLAATTQGLGVELELDARLESRPDPRVEVALYRVAYEAVMNAVKHSGAGTVCVTLEGRDGGAALEVQDGGCGFDPSTIVSSTGHRPLGLLGMRERVELLGGTFSLTTAPEQGVRISAWIPNERGSHG